MATYAIGDVQGCLVTLGRLLERVGFDPAQDELWFAGDLVNRGPHSIETLRAVMDLGESVRCVLGNHDLLLLALLAGLPVRRKKHTFGDLERISPEECDAMIEWLRSRPLMIRERAFAMIHAGLLPQWSVSAAEERARETEEALRSGDWREVLELTLSKQPLSWNERLRGVRRCATSLRAFSTLRVCTPEGEMHPTFNGPPEEAPEGYRPWYGLRRWHERDETILFGHWAALGHRMGPDFVALDSACVWGGSLTALRLEDRAVFQEAMCDVMDRDPRFKADA